MIYRSTNYTLEVFIKVGSYFALPDGEPKRYYQRRHLSSFVVDMDKCVILTLIDYIGAKCIWGSGLNDGIIYCFCWMYHR
jgi:hypothetical protein